MNFEQTFLKRLKEKKYIVGGEFVYYISELGLNYNVRIRETMTFLNFYNLKLKETKKLLKKYNLKLDFEFDILTEALDVVILTSGFVYDKSIDKLFKMNFTLYSSRNKFDMECDKKYEEIRVMYQYLETLIGYYYNYCIKTAKVLEIDNDIALAIRYTQGLLRLIKENTKKKENKYNKFVGVNLKSYSRVGV